MNKNIFEFNHYKPYLEARVGTFRERSGLKSKMAEAMGCQPTFVTQILKETTHLSLEQAHRLDAFFEHSGEESDFFLLLVQKDRAGTVELRKYFDGKLKEILSKRQLLVHRLGREQTLSQQDQGVYYSSWHYAALHIAVAVPELQSRDALASYFRLQIKRVTQVLDKLTEMGLVVYKNGKYSIGSARVRLGNDSHNIIKHHTNWRNQAIDSLDREEEGDLHYSGVLCLAKKDAQKIKDLIFEALQKHLEISDASAEEEIYSYCIDFFNLRK